MALPSGVATPNCGGCHAESGFDGDLTLSHEGELTPGQAASFTVTVRESHMSAAGFYVTTGGIGSFEAESGGRVSGGELMHSKPNAASDGVVEIHFTWTPPATAGGTEFGVYVVAANLNGDSSGDRANRLVKSFTWGCEPVTLYSDLDSDSFGNVSDTITRCEAEEYWSLDPSDCNDLLNAIHPGALEQANGRDDNCDGAIDEGIELAALYPDEDGDGFGLRGSTPFDGQIGVQGYAANADDCDDGNPEIGPDIAEICDGQDNNCDGQLDEGTFDYCGIGRCAQRLEICDRECVPLPPEPETCNGLDDDCDGFIDNGELCPAGQACVVFQCVPVDPAAPAPTSVPEVNGAAGGSNAPAVAEPSTSDDTRPGTSSTGQAPSAEPASPQPNATLPTSAPPTASEAAPGEASADATSDEVDPSSSDAAASADTPNDSGCSVSPVPANGDRPLPSLLVLGLAALATFRRRQVR